MKGTLLWSHTTACAVLIMRAHPGHVRGRCAANLLLHVWPQRLDQLQALLRNAVQHLAVHDDWAGLRCRARPLGGRHGAAAHHMGTVNI